MSQPHRLNRILVPLDGSDLAARALPFARTLSTPETEIVLCRIVRDPMPLVKLAGALANTLDRIRTSRLGDAQAYLAEVAGSLERSAGRVSAESSVGSPPDEILRIARERDVDLIVMTTHGRGFLGRVLIGSVADRVARAASCPVLLVRSKEQSQPVDTAASIARLVVPLDGSELARQALPVATTLAQSLNVPIHLVTAIPHPEEIIPQNDELSLDFYDDYVTAVSESLRAEADGFDTPATSEAIIGPPVDAILESVTDNDVIVMTSHGHGGMRRWWIGSVAERLTHIGKTPVMLVPVGDDARN